MSSRALAFLANDRYLDWAMTFLESVRSKDATLPLYCIPYGGRMTGILGLRKPFGFEVLEEGLDRLDAFAERLFPRYRRRRANLRKYAALTLPVDEVAYFDVDTVMLTEPRRLFGHIRPAHVDFLYLSTSPDCVYAAGKIQKARSLFPDMRLMSAGAFVTSRSAFTLDEVITTVEENLELYRSLRSSMVFDQPVLNFVLHRLAKRCRHVAEVDPTRPAGMVYSRDSNLRAIDGRIAYQNVAGDVLAIHWAGPKWLQRLDPPLRPIQQLRETLHQRAVQRVRQDTSQRRAS